MKHIKQLLVFLLIISVFNSCEKEEVVSYALDDISAPTNIAAQFDISAEEVGLVTITPSADGATMFEVYFGDEENETPTEVAPGETITHVYEEEGEFNLRIVAIGLTGLTSELVRVVTISMEAPEDLEVDIKISGTNPFEIEVSASATNATVFDIYFGDTEDEEPLTIMAGDTATYVYSETGDYTVRVVARGAGAATLEYTEEISITGASNAVTLPITFDDATVNYEFVTFNGASYEVVDNPDVSGANDTASKVGAITNSGAQYEGGTFELDPPVDFSGDNKTITMKFWSDVSLPVLLKFEGGVNNERQNEVSATHGGTGWEVLTFDFATDAVKSYIDGSQGVGEPFVPTGQYAKMVLFVDGPGTTAGTFYIDNIEHGGNVDGGGASDAMSLPLTFDGATVNYEFVTFNGASYEVVENPDVSGANDTASKVGAITNSGAQYEGGSFELDPPVDFSGDNKTITMKFWSDVSLPVLLKFEGGVNDERQNEVSATHGGTGWEVLTFNFATDAVKSYIDGSQGVGEPFVPTGQYAKMVLFVDGPGTTAGVFYVDDIEQSDANGGGNGDGGGTSGPTAAAPTPTAAAANVKSVFSDAYTDPSGVNYFPGWGQSTAYEMVSINGNNAIKYSNLNYQGIEIGESVDATAFESVRIDVWSGDYTSVPFFLISEGSGEKSVTLNLTPNQWNSIDIPLSEFTSQGLSVNDIFQFKFDVQPDNGGTIYIDNLYFYTSNSDGGTDGGTNGGTVGGATGDVAENGDFETGNLDGWAVYKNGGIIEADNTQSNGGDWSGKIVASSPAGLNPTLKQERKGAGTVTVGDIVQITFDYKGSAAAGGIYSIQSFVEAAEGVNQTEVFSVTPTASWQTFTTTYTVNAGDVSGGITMEFTAICGGDAACNSTLNLDNVSVILNP